MDIKLPVPIINAKTMLSFSTSHKLHHKKYFTNGLLSQDHILKFDDLFQHHPGLFRTRENRITRWNRERLHSAGRAGCWPYSEDEGQAAWYELWFWLAASTSTVAQVTRSSTRSTNFSSSARISSCTSHHKLAGRLASVILVLLSWNRVSDSCLMLDYVCVINFHIIIIIIIIINVLKQHQLKVVKTRQKASIKLSQWQGRLSPPR